MLNVGDILVEAENTFISEMEDDYKLEVFEWYNQGNEVLNEEEKVLRRVKWYIIKNKKKMKFI